MDILLPVCDSGHLQSICCRLDGSSERNSSLGPKTNQGDLRKTGFVNKGDIILHADRGSPMFAKTTAQLCMSLGITKSHNRPYVSNDNPYSESQFKTLKYFPGFPVVLDHCRIRFLSADHFSNGITTIIVTWNRHGYSDMHYGRECR